MKSLQKTITMTTKGTFTLPAELRAKMGVNAKGDKLAYTYDEARQQIIIKKPAFDLEALQRELSKFIKPGTPPLENVDEFYQKNRKVT